MEKVIFPTLSRFYADFIRILSRFLRNWFYRDFIWLKSEQNQDKIKIRSGCNLDKRTWTGLIPKVLKLLLPAFDSIAEEKL